MDAEQDLNDGLDRCILKARDLRFECDSWRARAEAAEAKLKRLEEIVKDKCTDDAIAAIRAWEKAKKA